MKRSEINHIMRQADQFIRAQSFYLPPFAYWKPEEWRARLPTAGEIVTNNLGWDITDFGSGDFYKQGLFLFTIRNGHPDNWKNRTGKQYAEKIMIVEPGQVTPMHFHWTKMEDIIVRGGGKLVVQLYNATPEDDLDRANPVQIATDGVIRQIEPGGMLELGPGESITLPPRCYHQFWGEGQTVLVGEVSSVNDDRSDNRFYQPIGRFPVVEEDEAPLYLLVGDYRRL